MKSDWIQRFFALVEIVDDDDSCWLWKGTVRRGYGNFRMPTVDGVRKTETATRVMWFLNNKQWPTKMMLHTCDVSRCVRPSHLFEGTHRDNTQDMIAKGRARFAGFYYDTTGKRITQ